MARPRKKTEPSLKLGDEFPEALQPLQADLGRNYSFDSEIARGKTGVAYKIKNRINGHFYCLKTIRPDIKDTASREDVRKNLEKEVEILLPLRHRCLPRIYEHVTSRRTELPYYVCTWHSGETFENFRKSGTRLSIDESAFVISSLISTFRTLHGSGRTHCDLHTKNILISKDVLSEGILVIDLGSGHHESDVDPYTDFRGDIHFKDFEGQAKSGVQVSRKEFNPKFRQIDFKAVGLLLTAMERSFFRDCSAVQLNAYREFCQKLVNLQVKSWPEVEVAFSYVLDPFKSLSDVNKLFIGEDGRIQKIRLPVSAPVSIGSTPLAVINTPSFQRLRGIKQLSFCDWFFPGATHTRFEHSLGVFGLTKQAAELLMQDNEFRRLVDTDDLKGLLLAGLLHDIGHYPFAHVLEQYTGSRLPGADETSVRARRAVSHSTHSIVLLDDSSLLKQRITESWGEAALQRALRILGKGGEMPVLTSLLDSAIDLDKTDYLTRDSVHCGVRFGDGIDRQGLLSTLCVVDNGRRLGISQPGVPIVEAHMVLQHEMLSQIYWNEDVRGVICMFHAILAYLLRKEVSKIELFAQELKACSSDHHGWEVIEKWINEKKGAEYVALTGLLNTLRSYEFNRLYRAIARYYPNDPIQKQHYSNVHNIIVAEPGSSVSQMPIDWDRVRKLHSAYFQEFKSKVSDIHKAEIVVDVPFGKGSHKSILVKSSGREDQITSVSHLNPSIFKFPAAYVSPVRIYVAPRILESCGDVSSIVVAAEHQFLKGAVEIGDEEHPS